MSDARRRLLVVEDESHLAAGLKLNLELEGYRVDVARTAREAGEHLLDPTAYDAIQEFRRALGSGGPPPG